MKKISVFIVRFLPFLLFGISIYIITTLLFSDEYVDFSVINAFHSHSFPYAASLFAISLADEKYHCVWNRAMYTELMFIPLINFIEKKYSIFMDEYVLLLVISVSALFSLIITIILAISHFVNKNRKKYGKVRYSK